MDVVMSNINNSQSYSSPSPAEFDKYLPWACKELQLWFDVIIIRTLEVLPMPSSRMSAYGKSVIEKPKDEVESVESFEITGEVVYVNAVYNNAETLVEVAFTNKNIKVPHQILQILGLIVKFYPYLHTIKIGRGLGQHGIYEINKIINTSKITTLILDNNTILQANFYILIESKNSLKYLSLARCSLNDAVMEKIASRLVTSTLAVLNLSSNKITDEGAKFLGTALRYNRKLRYLNLAGNLITDTGANSILSSLMEFCLTDDEIKEMKVRRYRYINEKKKITIKIYEELLHQPTNLPKQTNRRRGPTAEKSTMDTTNTESNWYEKADIIAKGLLESFDHLFDAGEIYVQKKKTHCMGNNALSYISLAYNNLTYLTALKIYDVLRSQEIFFRDPKGLVGICIEGNPIPGNCKELKEIERIIFSRLVQRRRTEGRKTRI